LSQRASCWNAKFAKWHVANIAYWQNYKLKNDMLKNDLLKNDMLKMTCKILASKIMISKIMTSKKWHFEMACWWNGKLTNWKVDKMASCCNDNLTKWQAD